MIDQAFIDALNEIMTALKERGYDPLEQLQGYVDTGIDSYITRHNGARDKIKKLDREQIRLFLSEQGR